MRTIIAANHKNLVNWTVFNMDYDTFLAAEVKDQIPCKRACDFFKAPFLCATIGLRRKREKEGMVKKPCAKKITTDSVSACVKVLCCTHVFTQDFNKI